MTNDDTPIDPGMTGRRPPQRRPERRPEPARRIQDHRSRQRYSAPPPRRRLWPFGVVIVLSVIAAAGVYLYGRTEPTVTIALEDTPESVADKLVKLNADFDPNEVVALLNAPGPGPVVGTYPVDTDASTELAVRALQAEWVSADPGITFPEGFTVTKIANRIAQNRWQYTADELIAASSALTVDPRWERPPEQESVEGLLFPSTYAVGSDSAASATMGQMLVEMQSLAFDDLGIADGAATLDLTPYQVMVVASLIEKEAKTPGDRPLIARVIYNRIERDMLLQIDASNYYNADPDASFSDLRERDTPYNLYLYKGLPPTPIANPGSASIEAALHPADRLDPSDERCADVAEADCALLYYVLADSDGNHKFAVTYDQHTANVEAAREAGVL